MNSLRSVAINSLSVNVQDLNESIWMLLCHEISFASWGPGFLNFLLTQNTLSFHNSRCHFILNISFFVCIYSSLFGNLINFTKYFSISNSFISDHFSGQNRFIQVTVLLLVASEKWFCLFYLLAFIWPVVFCNLKILNWILYSIYRM